MTFARKDFDDLKRYLSLYMKEVDASSAAVDVTTTDGERLCVLKTLDVTETTVTFLVYDEQVGIDPVEGNERHRHKRAMVLPLDHIRSLTFGPVRVKDAGTGFTP